MEFYFSLASCRLRTQETGGKGLGSGREDACVHIYIYIYMLNHGATTSFKSSLLSR